MLTPMTTLGRPYGSPAGYLRYARGSDPAIAWRYAGVCIFGVRSCKSFVSHATT